VKPTASPSFSATVLRSAAPATKVFISFDKDVDLGIDGAEGELGKLRQPVAFHSPVQPGA